jgi:hypothetical protein
MLFLYNDLVMKELDIVDCTVNTQYSGSYYNTVRFLVQWFVMDENCKEETYFISMMILNVLPLSVHTSELDDYPRGSKHVALCKKKYCFVSKMAVLVALPLLFGHKCCFCSVIYNGSSAIYEKQ